MLALLSVVMPYGLNDYWLVEGRPVYLKRSFPATLTTTTAQRVSLVPNLQVPILTKGFNVMDRCIEGFTLVIPLDALFSS